MTRSRSLFALAAVAILIIVIVGCKLSSLPGAKMNMFEGSNAQDGAAKIKSKIGVSDIKVSRMDIREDHVQIVVQDPNKPKNFDQYTYEKGSVKGPEPVPAMSFGNQELTADKSRLFNLSEVNLGLVPEVCKKAADKAQIEDGKCEIIAIDWESARWTRTKEENDKRAEERRQRMLKGGKFDPLVDLGDLVVTWRVWIKGPRSTKDFWVDKNGTVWDYH
jgi:hypothetical protein